MDKYYPSILKKFHCLNSKKYINKFILFWSNLNPAFFETIKNHLNPKENKFIIVTPFYVSYIFFQKDFRQAFLSTSFQHVRCEMFISIQLEIIIGEKDSNTPSTVVI